jgi:hypothetical protein
LRALRANRVFCTDEKRIRTENTVMDKNNKGLGLLLSTIRADGTPSAHAQSHQHDVYAFSA